MTRTAVSFPAATAEETYGLAVQNIEATDAVVSLELEDADGVATAGPTFVVSSNRYVVRKLSELFGFAPVNAAVVRIASAGPVQVLGAVANQVTGTASPILPR